MLTKKYGEPSECKEEFQGPGSVETDFIKLHRLKMDECTWFTTYSTQKDDIQLSIEHEGRSSCFVLLRYFDKINTDAVEKQAMDDL